MSYQRLLSDDNYKQNIIKRTQIIKIVRKFFDAQDFLEVETPLCVKLPGMEPYLHPFKTSVQDFKGNNHDAYLITSPEFAMKKLLVGGMEKIYQLGKCFRNNEQWGGRHNPEFTMFEWYRANSDYNAIIDDTIQLMKYICKELNNSYKFIYQKHEFDLEAIEVLTVAEAMNKYAHLDLDNILDYERIKQVCIKRGYLDEHDQQETWGDLFFKIFITEVEPNLGNENITVLKDYPVPLAALARRKKDDIQYAERFEMYCGGLELCNGFSELVDAQEQRTRFEEEWHMRKNLGNDVYDIDETFLKALELGMPESGGNALGIDRLVMLFTDSDKIEDVLLFPAGDIFN